MHLSDDELIWHYFDEESAGDAARAKAHLTACAACRAAYLQLERTLAIVSAAPTPDPPPTFERDLWKRVRRQLPEPKPGRRELLGLLGRPAFAGALAALVMAAFAAGWFVSRPFDTMDVAAPDVGQIRERILLVAIGEHLERSQMVLIELINTSGDGQVDLSAVQASAGDLLSANRMYRRTATETGEAGVADVLDELGRVLIEVARGPSQVSAGELTAVRSRIESRDVLFKLRVISSEVRARERSTLRTATEVSS